MRARRLRADRSYRQIDRGMANTFFADTRADFRARTIDPRAEPLRDIARNIPTLYLDAEMKREPSATIQLVCDISVSGIRRVAYQMLVNLEVSNEISGNTGFLHFDARWMAGSKKELCKLYFHIKIT